MQLFLCLQGTSNTQLAERDGDEQLFYKTMNKYRPLQKTGWSQINKQRN